MEKHLHKEHSKKYRNEAPLHAILSNWLSTLFAYQPEIYFQIDHFRRKLKSEYVTSNELHNVLLAGRLLTISQDKENIKKFYLKLDSDMFPRARGKIWSVLIHEEDSELEFSCLNVPGMDPPRPQFLQ